MPCMADEECMQVLGCSRAHVGANINRTNVCNVGAQKDVLPINYYGRELGRGKSSVTKSEQQIKDMIERARQPELTQT